jgi:hypothetical protein
VSINFKGDILRNLLFAIFAAFLLSGCSGSELEPTPKSLDTLDLAKQVTQLYQEIDESFATSFSSGLDFIIANNYPGAFDPTALQACALAKQPYIGETVTGGVPRVETLQLIPNWIGKESTAADWLLAGKTVDGNVYKFDLEIDLEIIEAQIVEANGQVFLLYGWCDDFNN